MVHLFRLACKDVLITDKHVNQANRNNSALASEVLSPQIMLLLLLEEDTLCDHSLI